MICSQTHLSSAGEDTEDHDSELRQSHVLYPLSRQTQLCDSESTHTTLAVSVEAPCSVLGGDQATLDESVGVDTEPAP